LLEPAFSIPAVIGQTVHWAGGQINYYVDQGPLSSFRFKSAGHRDGRRRSRLWSAVPTAGVTLADSGPLNEDVSGANFTVDSSGAITAPADVTPRPPTILSP